MIISKQDFETSISKIANPLPGSKPQPTPYKLSVKQQYHGLTIIDFLLKAVPKVDKEIWLKKIETNSLLIDGKPATINSTVYGGNITTHFSEPKIEPFVNANIEYIFCDEDILVLNKPAPLPMHPSGRFNKNSLTELLKLAFPNENFKIIHRLDANTTGVIILGRNNKVVNEIGKQIQDQKATKIYNAIVEGIPHSKIFSSSTKISKEKTAAGGRKTSNNGIEAYTEFEVIKSNEAKNLALLSVKPFNGRTNQIRLHLADLNLPILGDLGYKNPDYFKNNPLTYSEDCLFLHASSISFYYKKKQVTFIANLPEKFNTTI